MANNASKSLGIIGIGQFAEFFIPHLKPYFSRIVISSRNDKSAIAIKLGVLFSDPIEAASQDYVILAMPISEIKNVLKQIKHSVKTQSVIMDICSVKIYPMELMEQILPADVNILGTHPLFGPQSGKNGVNGLEIVLCPSRISPKLLVEAESVFKRMGLKIISSTPEQHDRIMANTQALTHFFAKGVLKTINTDNMPFSTPSARRLFDIINDIKYDSETLFRDIEIKNPYAKSIRDRLINNLTRINSDLSEKNS